MKTITDENAPLRCPVTIRISNLQNDSLAAVICDFAYKPAKAHQKRCPFLTGQK